MGRIFLLLVGWVGSLVKMADVRKTCRVYNVTLYRVNAGKFVFFENLQFGASLHHLSPIFIDDNMMCISLFSYGSPVVVRCMQGRPVIVKHDARCVMGKVGGRQKPKRGEGNFNLLL